MGQYKSKDAWDPTVMTDGKKPVGDPPPLAKPRDDYEIGDVAVAEKPRLQAKRSTARTAWLLVVLLLTAAVAFAILEYLPMRRASEESTAALTAARTENARLVDKMVAIERKRSELESTQTQLQSVVQEKDKALAELTKTQDELTEKLQSEIQKGDVLIKQRGGELVVDLVDQILFDSGEAELNEQGKAVLQKVGDAFLKHADKVIQVGGHTDNVPISPKLLERFPSNWELSTARATHVVRFLQEIAKVPGKRLVATGFSEFRPTASNKTNTGRRKNRRIEVVLLPTHD